MAVILSLANVLELPDGTNFAGQTNPCPQVGCPLVTLSNPGICAPTATQIQAYPAATAQVNVKYYMGNNVLTGAYIVGNRTVAQLITDSNA